MIKANFDEESAEKAKKQVQQTIDKVLNNKKMLNEVGELIVTDIVRQTRTGKKADGSPLGQYSTNRYPFLYKFYGDIETEDTVEKARKSLSGRKKEFERVSKLRASYQVEGLNWRIIREAIAKTEGSHPAFRKNKLNLTLSGQLLDSFKSFIVGKGKLVLKFVGVHKTYSIKTRKGIGTVGKNTPNKVIAEGLNERFGFLGVRPQVIDRAKTIIVGYIRRSRRAIEKITK